VRKGAPQAAMALAQHLITIVYNVLARGEEYVEYRSPGTRQGGSPQRAESWVARGLSRSAGTAVTLEETRRNQVAVAVVVGTRKSLAV
jgi:hypothetical protein